MRILLTGSNGLVGQKILSLLKGCPDFQVTATSKNPSLYHNPDGFIFERADLTDLEAVRNLLSRCRPQIIIHSAAMTQVDLCEQNQPLCRQVNVESVQTLLNEAQRYHSRLLYLSTDFVFDGKNGPYKEEDTPAPLNFYGRTKLEAEKLIIGSGMPWTIIRTILVYGIAPRLPRPNILFLVKNKLEKGESLRMAIDQIRMPTLAEDLAQACVNALIKQAQGIYHVSGEESVSIYEFALKIAKAWGLNSSLITPIATETLNEPAQRPRKTGFILEKSIKDLEYKPHSISEGLALVKKQFETLPGNE